MATTIHFEDHGQDFLDWTVDDKSNVIDVNPFQFNIWGGNQVLGLDTLQPGDYVHYVSKHDGETRTIRYPVERIERKQETTDKPLKL